MPLTKEQQSELENRILDNIDPPCPICGSTLQVGKVQVGDSGSKGRNYSCTKDRLKESEKERCDLVPGIAHITGFRNIKLALTNRISSTTVGVITGTVSLASIFIIPTQIPGLADKLPDWWPLVEAQADTNVSKSNTDQRLVEAQKMWAEERTKLELQLKKLQTEGGNNAQESGSDAEKILRENRWRIGMSLITSGKSTGKAVEFLMTALANQEIENDDEVVSVVTKLREVIPNEEAYETWDEFLGLLELKKNRSGLSSWAFKFENLAIIHYKLQERSSADQKKQHLEKALKFYRCQHEIKPLQPGSTAYISVLKLLRYTVQQGTSQVADQALFEEQFVSGILPENC